MSIKPLTERQKSLIVNNVVKACYDINKLNQVGYKYLYLANGFIAHYNIAGFRDYYSHNDLMAKVLQHEKQNEWNNFKETDSNYDYYMSKREVYKRICSTLRNKTLNTWNS